MHALAFILVACDSCPIYQPKLLYENSEKSESTSQKDGVATMVSHGYKISYFPLEICFIVCVTTSVMCLTLGKLDHVNKQQGK